jgi:hypothetical protein
MWEIFCRFVRSLYLWWEFYSIFNRKHEILTKNSTTPLLIGAAAIAAWWLFSRANALNSLIFIPRGVGLQGGGLNFILGVQNPTGSDIALNSLAGSINVAGQPVGNVSSFTPRTIKANSETSVPLYLSANAFGIVGDIVNLLDGNEGSGNFQASLTGTANVNNIAVPVSLNFTS